MEQAPDNDNAEVDEDNGLDWELDGPDEAGRVWLSDKGPKVALRMLGKGEAVAAYLTEWLAQQDYGERP